MSILTIIMEENFFGIGTGNSFYDKRRHINIVLIELLSYRFYINPSLGNRIVSIVKDTRKSIEEKASDICNDILSYDEHNYLNLLRERVQISNQEFMMIMSGIGLGQETKSPASYTREQNIALLVELIVARYYMTPKVNDAFIQINTMIMQLAKGMRGITITQQNAESLFQLTQEAMTKYSNNYALAQIEDFVISKWK